MKRKMKAVEEALDAVFSDTTVPHEVSLENMEEIQSWVEAKIEALKSDIAIREKADA